MLAFYAYIVIGIDDDTFAKYGGDPVFQKALTYSICPKLANARLASVSGQWNRYWLIENLTNQQLRPIREAYYTYHRLRIDIFADKPDDGRNQILDAIKKVQGANRQLPNSVLEIAFFDAKAEELSKIFEKGSPAVKKEAYTILVDFSPSDTEKFKTILGN